MAVLPYRPLVNSGRASIILRQGAGVKACESIAGKQFLVRFTLGAVLGSRLVGSLVLLKSRYTALEERPMLHILTALPVDVHVTNFMLHDLAQLSLRGH